LGSLAALHPGQGDRGYGQRRWLGDPSFADVFRELNRRKAVVYTHAQVPDCCQGLIPGISDTTIEYNTDTARTIISLIESGRAGECPNDTAGSNNPIQMAALKKLVSTSQIVFGTDFPFGRSANIAEGLEEWGIFSADELRSIDRENAFKILPKFKT
jgi:hypothetical protein